VANRQLQHDMRATRASCFLRRFFSKQQPNQQKSRTNVKQQMPVVVAVEGEMECSIIKSHYYR